jgi:hypothetical protein
VVVLAPRADQVSIDDLAILRDYLAEGGWVVTSPNVGAALTEAVPFAPDLVLGGLVERRGSLLVAQKGVAVLFEDRRHTVLSPFWQEVLGVDGVQPGYRILTGQYVFHYNIGPEPVVLRSDLPFPTLGNRFDVQARPVERIHGSDLMVSLERREYVFLWRVRQAGPRRWR